MSIKYENPQDIEKYNQLSRIESAVRTRIEDDDYDGNLVKNAIANAYNFVLGYTNRSVLLEEMEHIVEELACIQFNQAGDEGLNDRVQGALKITYSNELPPHLITLLNSYRLLGRRRRNG